MYDNIFLALSFIFFYLFFFLSKEKNDQTRENNLEKEKNSVYNIKL